MLLMNSSKISMQNIIENVIWTGFMVCFQIMKVDKNLTAANGQIIADDNEDSRTII
jgi:hypothetical protein